VKKHWYKVGEAFDEFTSAVTDLAWVGHALRRVRRGRSKHLLVAQGECVLTNKKSASLLAAIKEYDANKWKVIGQKVGKPAKVC
jgi:hypothetical protein